MIDFPQLALVWPPIAILLIGLVSGWFLQRHVLIRQMEDIETQHLDLLRAAEDEMHAARDEARLQGHKLEEAQSAITLGYERLTLLDRRLKEAEDRLIAPSKEPAPDPAAHAEIAHLRRQLADQQAFAERLNQLERELQAAKAAAQSAPEVRTVVVPSPEQALALRERDATIDSLRHEVASIEKLRLQLSDMVSQLGLAQSQIDQLTRDRQTLLAQAAQTAPPAESTNELVRKLAEAIARRQELEIAFHAANLRAVAAEAQRDQMLAVQAVPTAGVAIENAPKAMAAGASAGASFTSFPTPAWNEPAAPPPPDRREEDFPEPVVPLLSPAQLAGGLGQILFENRIQFLPERADILPDSKLLLEDIADLILSSEPVRLVVEGHTERGDARASYYLSERRAVSVMERLAALGVPPNRMMSVGYGDTRPIDENSSYEGRMRNRRIEIRILGRC